MLFERLIDPERLSLADGIRTSVVEAKLADGEQHMLADLDGPGAIIQVWRSKPSGHISFYFDGQTQPAIDCLANLLYEHAPHLAEEKDPVLTCLPFARSVQIALRDAPGAEYRIEYARFPAELRVETYQPGLAVLPRGWLAAIDYRQHQYGWGTHREQDPAPRDSGTIDALGPGQSAALIKLDGAGIVQWLKLQADPAVLRHDDLWLDVSVDGEPQPALAAPARYFFPALSSHVPLVGTPSNHYNFANVYRGGFTNMLAMPFARGLTVSVRNAGQTALEKLTVTASVLREHPADPAWQPLRIAERMRLRGRFERRPVARPGVAFRRRSPGGTGLVRGNQGAAAAGRAVYRRPRADRLAAESRGCVPGRLAGRGRLLSRAERAVRRAGLALIRCLRRSIFPSRLRSLPRPQPAIGWCCGTRRRARKASAASRLELVRRTVPAAIGGFFVGVRVRCCAGVAAALARGAICLFAADSGK